MAYRRDTGNEEATALTRSNVCLTRRQGFLTRGIESPTRRIKLLNPEPADPFIPDPREQAREYFAPRST